MFIVAAAIAAVVASLLAVDARPAARAPDRTARRRRAAHRRRRPPVRVPEDGPAELRALAAAYNAMVDRLAEQERGPARVRRQRVARAADPAHEPAGLPRGAPRRRAPARSRHLRLAARGGRPADPARRVARHPRRRRGRAPGARGGRPRRRSCAPADLVAPALARRSIGCASTRPTDSSCDARPDELAQVLANLLQNAVRYTPAGGAGRGRAARGPEGVPGPRLEHGAGHPARRPAARLGALLPRREVARPGAGRRGRRARDRASSSSRRPAAASAPRRTAAGRRSG